MVYFKHKADMKFCVIIPCYNHAETLGSVLKSLPTSLQAIVVDDGSDIPVKVENSDVHVLRLSQNLGKASALIAGFNEARKFGATHVITIDSDGQHPAEYIPFMMSIAEENPNDIVVAVRDFENSKIPPARKFLNKFSNFWFRVETKKNLNDTQCGFRCYPLALLDKLDLCFDGFVFEVELLVKAAWAGTSFSEIKIPALYSTQTLKKSHYKPIMDTWRFTVMNTRLYFASVFLPKKILKKIALKK